MYLREGFVETPAELIAMATSPGDKVILAGLLNVDSNVDNTEVCTDCGETLNAETHNCI